MDHEVHLGISIRLTPIAPSSYPKKLKKPKTKVYVQKQNKTTQRKYKEIEIRRLNTLNIQLKKRRLIRLISCTESILKSLVREHHEEAKILLTPTGSYTRKLEGVHAFISELFIRRNEMLFGCISFPPQSTVWGEVVFSCALVFVPPYGCSGMRGIVGCLGIKREWRNLVSCSSSCFSLGFNFEDLLQLSFRHDFV